MRVWLEHDTQDDVWTIRHDGCVIASKEDIDRWQTELDEALVAKGAHPVDLFVDVHGFELSPAVAELYGKVARTVIATHARCLIRYGDPGGLTTASVRLQAVINRFPANLFADREAATEALRRIRATRAAAS